MKNRLLTSLARLGSKAYQEAFLIGGSRDEYVLPEDLVEDVASLIGLAVGPEYRHQFSEDQLVDLSDLLHSIQSRGPALFSNTAERDLATLVREDPIWSLLRGQAIDSLRSFGIDVEAVPPNLIDAGNLRAN